MPRYRKINRSAGGFTQPRHEGRMGRKPSGGMPRMKVRPKGRARHY